MASQDEPLAWMVTEVTRAAVTYEVFDEDPRAGQEFGTTRPIWSKRVEFDIDERHRAGGHAFREAAREQEYVASELARTRNKPG